jgi:peptidoglycan/xylan/chitin deacetylase (PgdA/CDA1 family)
MISPKSLLFRVLPVLTSGISLDLLIKLTNRKVVFPFYHAVSDGDIIHIRNLYKVKTTAQFISDLEYLLKNYRPVSHEDLLSSIRADEPLRGKCFLLSFDDGLREFYDIVAPVLLRKGISAVCFLNSAFVDNKDLFYRYKASILVEESRRKDLPAATRNALQQWLREECLSGNLAGELLRISYARRDLLDKAAAIMGIDFREYLKAHHPYLTGSQVTELVSQGFAFGAHSIDHPQFGFLSEEEQVAQTQESLDDIAGKFGLNYRLFSFPFTDSGVKSSFFRKVFDPKNPVADITFGGAGLKDDFVPNHIQRIPFEESSLGARQILTSEYSYWLLKAIAGRNRIKR